VSDFLEALAATREAYRQDEYAHRVKDLIARKLRELDSEALVEDTHYFNHSAIPDFVVTWSGEKTSRDFYLRGSYAAILASKEVEATSASEPVFMSLDSNQDFSAENPPISPEMIREEPSKSTRTLLTDVRAMGEILDPPPSDTTPLTQLVKSSFVRGGRGLIDEDRAEALVSTGNSEVELSKVVHESFFENVALRMERTATIVDLALDQSRGESLAEDALARLTGRLSKSELQAILPWLLKQEHGIRDESFWRKFGAMTSFKDVEDIADELEGLDIGALLLSNMASWTAQRAYLGVSSQLAFEATSEALQNHWSFRGGILGVDAGIHRVSFSSDGRTLRGRDESAAPTWDDLSRNLEAFRLSSVNLRGVTRSVRIDAEESDDIRQDVEDVAASLDDTYSVSEVSLRFAPRETKSGYATVAVKFGKGLAISETGTTIEDLTRSSLQVLAYRSPLGEELVDELVTPTPRWVRRTAFDFAVDEAVNRSGTPMLELEGNHDPEDGSTAT
jgi:hypothetical protein